MRHSMMCTAVVDLLEPLHDGELAIDEQVQVENHLALCAACHATDTTTNKVGPHLGDVIGRTAGTVENFNYSKAMKDAGVAGLVWDEAHLTEYLVAPKAKVPGTKMAFAGIKKPDELGNLVAYLKSLPE